MAESDSAPSKPFRVIIVGGGVVGLSLSHAFQLANIDHVVLEKHDRIVSLRGAALMIWPGVARIFDQFGFLDKILKSTTPVTKEYVRWPDGSVCAEDRNVQTLAKLFEKPVILFDRQALVSNLYENLPDKSRIHTSRRLERIEHTETGVRVHLTDGTVEEGDMVVGADGVHSNVRSLMWDYATKVEPEAIPKSDRSAMFSEYGGLYGVSTQKDSFGLGPADVHIVHGHDDSKLLFTQPGEVYWGYMFKEERSQPPKKRSADENDIEALAKRIANSPFTDKLKFSDLWEARKRCGLVNIEEGILDKWHAGRIVLVGDSAFKMTAELGMGANIAIESAVTLSNILHRELKSNPNRHFSKSELSALFAEYQKNRFGRAKAFVNLSGKASRDHSYQTLFGRFMVGYVEPYLERIKMRKMAEIFALSPKLDYVPVRTINENAVGWNLAKEDTARTGWLTYVLLTSTIGVTIAYVARSGLPALF